MQGIQHFTVAGVDVAKQSFDWCIQYQDAAKPSKVTHTSHDANGLQDLVDACKQAKVNLVVLEATGGLERAMVRALAQANIAFHVANPRQIRDFARALGLLAKTDSIDARVLATYGLKIQPKAHVLPSDLQQKLQDWSTRHAQLIDMHTVERNRLHSCFDEAIAEMIQQQLDALEAQLETVAKQMDALIDADADMQTKAECMTSMPGIGRLTAQRLLADLPELGTASRGQIAKLVGLAPINRDSGTLRGKRMTGGGRKPVRTLLYMPTLVAVRHNPMLRSMYLRLVANGKAKMVALVACMRKLVTLLNAMLRDKKNWEQFIASA